MATNFTTDTQLESIIVRDQDALARLLGQKTFADLRRRYRLNSDTSDAVAMRLILRATKAQPGIDYSFMLHDEATLSVFDRELVRHALGVYRKSLEQAFRGRYALDMPTVRAKIARVRELEEHFSATEDDD